MQSIPNEHVLNAFDEEEVRLRMKKIIKAKKKAEETPRVNYLKELIDKRIDFQTFLVQQHDCRVSEMDEQFIFTSDEVFQETARFLNKMTGDVGKEKKDIEHELRHFEKARKYQLETYFAIKMNVKNRTGTKWELQPQPSLVVLVEKKALEEQWSIRDYAVAVRNIAEISDMSEGDAKTVESVELLEEAFGLK